jgi:type IV pilus assembly protein PilF
MNGARVRLLLAGATALLLAACSGANMPLKPEIEKTTVNPNPGPKVGDSSTRAKVHTELGIAYYQGGQMAVALEEARVAVNANPNYAPAYGLLGLIHMYLKEDAEALANFERAARLDPNDAEIANSYGWFLCTQGRERDGLVQLMRAVKDALYPTPTKPWTNAGLCALRLKDDAGAEEYFRKAAIADPGNTQAIYHLADIYFRKGNYYDARRFVTEVHRVMDPNAESLWLALRVERKLGDRQAEAGFASQLRRKFPGTPQHQALLQGRYE